ncbi:hypothetical protein J7M23_00835 [Candidatus Sumerlaeota bacterium]|nr:hypothetical protein [Candidatus Sumerlaeota bacterium]
MDYHCIIRDVKTGKEYWQKQGWQRLTRTQWFIWMPRFTGVDDSPAGKPITTPWIQIAISDHDSVGTGYIYCDIAEIRLGKTWESAREIKLRDSSRLGINANRWYIAWSNVNWQPRFAYLHKEPPGFVRIGTLQTNMKSDNSQWWDQNLIPPLPGNGHSLYLKYRLAPESSAPVHLIVRGLDENGDFEFIGGGWADNLVRSHKWQVKEFVSPTPSKVFRIGICVSDIVDTDSSTGLLLVDISQAVWAPSGFLDDIDKAARSPKATLLQPRDYVKNKTPGMLSDFYTIWFRNYMNLGYAFFIK